MCRISIIVPVYKVEPYLKKCIDSILQQTFTDFELILVDDGSPDSCGIICDEYAQKDKRIKVIHKENGGLSDARNAGIDIAQGIYVGFVDSDDCIAPDMYQSLMNDMITREADIAICGIIDVYESGEERPRIKSEISCLMSKEEALEKMLNQYPFDTSAWNKLYKKSLFDGIRYPYGKLAEDLFTTYKLIDRCSVIVFNSNPKYYYLRRQGSIMSGSFNRKLFCDALEASQDLVTFVSEKYVKLTNGAVKRYVATAVGCVEKMLTANYTDKEMRQSIMGELCKYKETYFSNSNVKFIAKLELWLLLNAYPLFSCIIIICKKLSIPRF